MCESGESGFGKIRAVMPEGARCVTSGGVGRVFTDAPLTNLAQGSQWAVASGIPSERSAQSATLAIGASQEPLAGPQ